jgi:hypothetical protein
MCTPYCRTVKKNKKVFYEIVFEAISKLEEKTIVLMPKMAPLRDELTRKRSKIDGCREYYDDMLMMFKNTLRGDLFLQYDSGFGDSERIVMFFSDENFKSLKKAETWLFDGNFSITPLNFYQLYTIHGILFGRSFPLIYITMKTKSKESYIKTFQILNKNNDLNPVSLVLDFEIGAINAAKIVFFNSNIYGCLIYFCQAIWRHVQSLNLTGLYK